MQWHLRKENEVVLSYRWQFQSFPGENARSWEALGEARPGQSSLSAETLRYRAWAHHYILTWQKGLGTSEGIRPIQKGSTLIP